MSRVPVKCPGSHPTAASRGGWPGSDRCEGEPTGVYDRGAFHALLSSIYRTSTGSLTAAGDFGGAAIHGHIGEFQADEVTVTQAVG